MWNETKEERIARKELQAIRVRECKDAISAAVLKVQMTGLTFPECMVECPLPDGIHPLRWRAMIKSALQNGIPE